MIWIIIEIAAFIIEIVALVMFLKNIWENGWITVLTCSGVIVVVFLMLYAFTLSVENNKPFRYELSETVICSGYEINAERGMLCCSIQKDKNTYAEMEIPLSSVEFVQTDKELHLEILKAVEYNNVKWYWLAGPFSAKDYNDQKYILYTPLTIEEKMSEKEKST